MMIGGDGQANQLHWDTLDHAYRAPQFTLCNYYDIVHVCVLCTWMCMVAYWGVGAHGWALSSP